MTLATYPDDAPDDAPGDDCPDHGPHADDECPKCRACHTPNTVRSSARSGLCLHCANAQRYGFDDRFAATRYAQTLQSIAIERRMHVCGYCKGIHHIQKCPLLWSRLFAPGVA